VQEVINLQQQTCSTAQIPQQRTREISQRVCRLLHVYKPLNIPCLSASVHRPRSVPWTWQQTSHWLGC